MRGLPRRSGLRLASTLAGGALIGVLALADGIWPVPRPGTAPPGYPAPAAAAGGCVVLNPSGLRQEILSPGLERQAHLLCYKAFEVLYSGVARVPIWSAQRLDAGALAQARAVARKDTFRAEPRLPAGERAELSDYACSGFDRGHLTPAADMPTPLAPVECFLLTNMVSPGPADNRGLWVWIESGMRGQAQRAGGLYVLTRIAALEEHPAFVGGRMLVPLPPLQGRLRSAVGRRGGLVVAERSGGDLQVLSLDALKARTGLRVFPTVSGPARARAMELPTPTVRFGPSPRNSS